MVNLHLKSSGMQNVEIITFTTTLKRLTLAHFYPSINSSSPALIVLSQWPIARIETLTTKYSSQIKATLNTNMKETGGERKTGRCGGTCSQTHRPSQLLDTLLDTHNSAFQRAHHRLFSNAWSVGVWSSHRNEKLRSPAHKHI